MTFEREEKDAYQVNEGSDAGDRRDRSPKRKKTLPGCSCSVCSLCRFINSMKVPDWGPPIEELGYGSDRDLCPPEYEDERQMV